MDSGSNKRELFEQFASITGCKTSRKISHYLEACHFDLAMAVDLFFAQAGAGGAQQENDDVAMLSDDEEAEPAQGHSKTAPPSTSKHSHKNGKNGYHNHDDQPVRPPIPSTRSTIVNAPYSAQYVAPLAAGPVDNVFNQRAAYRHQVDNERIREQLERLDPQPHRRNVPRNQVHEIVPNDHRSMLQNLFKPPTDISFTGPFESAKELASDLGKWLLVNVQDVREFACQTLNRDIWSNEGVKELISTNFVFWQVRHDTVDGQRLINYYKLKGFPAVFILDPRTGELVQTFTIKKQDPVTICDFLSSYLDKFPDYYAHDKFLKGSAEVLDTDIAFHLGNVPEFASEPECSKSVMFDEEEMQRLPRKRKGADEEQNGKKAKVEYMDVLNEPTRMLSVVDKDEWLQECSSHGEICRIRLKLPDGRMETIEVSNESKLKALFVFIAGRNLTPKEHIFVLSFPRREFSVDDADRTLSALGFSRNEMVHVELK